MTNLKINTVESSDSVTTIEDTTLVSESISKFDFSSLEDRLKKIGTDKIPYEGSENIEQRTVIVDNFNFSISRMSQFIQNTEVDIDEMNNLMRINASIYFDLFSLNETHILSENEMTLFGMLKAHFEPESSDLDTVIEDTNLPKKETI